MKVAFIVRNNMSEKFVLAEGLSQNNALCVYDTDNHKIEWMELSNIANSFNLALSFFDLGIQKVVSSRMDDYLVQKLSQNEISVLQAQSSDLVENIKLFNQHQLHDMLKFSVPYFRYVRRSGYYFASSAEMA